MRGNGRDLCEKRVAFDVAMLAKACSDAVKIAVVVAGMADEFEGAFGGDGLKNLVQGFAVEVAGGGDADGAIRCDDATTADLRLLIELGLETAEKFDLKATDLFPVAKGEAPILFERLADREDRVLLR